MWLPKPCPLTCGPTCGQRGYTIPAVSRVPNAQHGDKIRSGYFTHNVLGKSGQTGCITLAVLEVPNTQHMDRIRSGF